MERVINDTKLEEKIKKEIDKKTIAEKTDMPQAEESVKSPVDSPQQPEDRGGIFGGTSDKPITFKDAQKIGGGVERQRDRTSQQPLAYETYMQTMKRIEEQIKRNTVSATVVEKMIKNHMDSLVRGSQILSNPQNMIGNSLVRMLGGAGPYGALAVAAVSGIVIIPETIEQIIKTLAHKGLPLNRDFRRVVEEEVNALFDFEAKKRRLLGIDSYVVTQTDRYQPDTGGNTYNSLENRDEVIISKFGLAEKALGVR